MIVLNVFCRSCMSFFVSDADSGSFGNFSSTAGGGGCFVPYRDPSFFARSGVFVLGSPPWGLVQGWQRRFGNMIL